MEEEEGKKKIINYYCTIVTIIREGERKEEWVNLPLLGWEFGLELFLLLLPELGAEGNRRPTKLPFSLAAGGVGEGERGGVVWGDCVLEGIFGNLSCIIVEEEGLGELVWDWLRELLAEDLLLLVLFSPAVGGKLSTNDLGDVEVAGGVKYGPALLLFVLLLLLLWLLLVEGVVSRERGVVRRLPSGESMVVGVAVWLFAIEPGRLGGREGKSNPAFWMSISTADPTTDIGNINSSNNGIERNK